MEVSASLTRIRAGPRGDELARGHLILRVSYRVDRDQLALAEITRGKTARRRRAAHHDLVVPVAQADDDHLQVVLIGPEPRHLVVRRGRAEHVERCGRAPARTRCRRIPAARAGRNGCSGGWCSRPPRRCRDRTSGSAGRRRCRSRIRARRPAPARPRAPRRCRPARRRPDARSRPRTPPRAPGLASRGRHLRARSRERCRRCGRRAACVRPHRRRRPRGRSRGSSRDRPCSSTVTSSPSSRAVAATSSPMYPPPTITSLRPAPDRRRMRSTSAMFRR